MDLVRQAWHHPVSGPVILVIVGLPLLVLVFIVMVAFPVMTVFELGKTLLVNGYQPFAKSSALWLATLTGLWVVFSGLAFQVFRLSRANNALTKRLSLKFGHDQGDAEGFAAAVALAGQIRNLIAVDREGVDVSEVIEEDYGAGIWLSRGPETLWLAVADGGEAGKAGIRTMWLALAYDPALDVYKRLTHMADAALHARVFAAVEAALRALPDVSSIRLDRAGRD